MNRVRFEHPGQRLYLPAFVLAALLFALVLIVGCGTLPSPATQPAPPATTVPATQPAPPATTAPATQPLSPATATWTAQPASPGPTGSATASPSLTLAPAKALSHLALGLRAYRTGFINPFVRPGDILGSGFKNGISHAAEILSSVPEGERMLMFPTIVGLTTTLDGLNVPIDYIGYDLEQGGASPAEIQDPVQAVKTAQQIAHSRGLQLVIGPARYFVEKYGTQMAPYADVYVPQTLYYQANLAPAEYEQTLRTLFTSLKQANPQVKIFLDISPSPKTAQKMPAEMLQSVQSVLDLIDGVWITYSPTETQQVLEFVKLIGR